MRPSLKRVPFGRRGRRVPKRNSTFLRLEELETRTVLATSPFGLGLTAAGIGGIHPSLFQFLASAPTASQVPPGLANAPGIARQLATLSGGTTSSPVTPTVPGTSTGTLPGDNVLVNPGNLTNLTQTTTTGPVSSQTATPGTDTSSNSAPQNGIGPSFSLLAPETTQATTTNNNTTGNPSTQQSSAGPQSLLLIVLNQPLLVAGATQRAETVAIITAAESNPEGAVISPQMLASARASTNPQLQVLLGEVPLSATDDDGDGDRKDDKRRLDKPMIRDMVPPKPPKQEKNEQQQKQPDDKDVPPVVPLEEAVLSEDAVDTASSDACFAIWEAEMAPTEQETQPPVPASAEETPNWSVAALGLVLGGVWSLRPARPRDDRKRNPAWPARPTLPM